MIINVALTGAVVSKRENVHVPLTPDEIIADAMACAAAGASVFHLHMRDDAGAPVHDRALYEATFRGIRAAAPELVLCATTSSRVERDPAARMLSLTLPPAFRPDMASLTLGSFNFPRVVSNNPPETIVALLEAMREHGVRPELEVFELGMVNTLWVLRERGLIPDPPVVNILLGSMGSAPAFVSDLGHIVERLPPGSEWAAAGIGIFQRPMTIAAAIMNGNVRTGLEDDPRGDGTPEWSNVHAVRLAVAAAKLAGRSIATAREARARYGLRAVAVTV
jgi:3-keto-5-aminohexanoate cleavage enzyme